MERSWEHEDTRKEKQSLTDLAFCSLIRLLAHFWPVGILCLLLHHISVITLGPISP